MSANSLTVFVIDDDLRIRTSLKRLFELENLRAEVFPCPEEFLALKKRKRPACVVSDIRMPGLSGLELLDACHQQGIQIPMVFITGHGDIPMCSQAMKKGAVDFLPKPFNTDILLQVVKEALQKDEVELQKVHRLNRVKHRKETLTPREQEVLKGVIAGHLNKQIALRLGVRLETIKFHRAHVMRKMKATSVANLVRLAESASLLAPENNRIARPPDPLQATPTGLGRSQTP